MNEGLVTVSFVVVIAVAYASCAVLRRGSWDVGKCFEGLGAASAAIIAIFAVIHALMSIRANSPYQDALFIASAGIAFAVLSLLHLLKMFREIFNPPKQT
jgi:hypothetical protein